MYDQLATHDNTKLSAFPIGKTNTLALITLALFLVVSLSRAGAQGVVTDNFDSGSISAWQSRNVVQPLGGFVSDSFPANGPGLALRLQRGSADMSVLGQPQAYGTGRAWLFRTNIYSDFYVAMDLLNWNNATNQAIVLLARATGYDDVLSPGFPPGLGTVNGYVCNYDNAQDGDGPGDRLGGQFQINRVDGEAPATIAAAEVTLKEGHTYRLVFNGVGPLLTGRIYDIEDLTQPIVTIVAEDSAYPSGVSGIVTFHRNNSVHPNLTDLTVDNYYAGPADPNVSIAPALPHPLAGTPQVVTRNPTNRFTNFHAPTQGISFTVATFTTNQIDAAATRLYLNGADVSASLTPLPANGPNASFSTAPSTLTNNQVYSARIEVQDIGGLLKSTNTFWFDTFSDSYLTNLVVIEAEDYNFEGGKFQRESIPVSGIDTNGNPVGGGGVGYVDLHGTSEIDYHDVRISPENGWNDFRIEDFVGTLQGNREDIEDLFHAPPTTPPNLDPARPNDTTRRKYAVLGLKEYQVARTEAGEWLNYTRVFPATNYNVYLRVGSFGAQDVQLNLVGGDPTTVDQTTSVLGTFSIPNQLMRLNYNYVPLMNGNSLAVVDLGGTNTVRLTMGGTAVKDSRLLSLNYLVFVPAGGAKLESTVFDNFNDGNDTIPPVGWTRYNPIGTGSWSFPGGNSYRIQSAPSPDPSTLFQGRAGSLLPGSYSDFYVSADIVGWDPSIHQVVGILARVNNAGPGTTTGYLFSHDSGDPSNPTAGDMDIVRLDGEIPTVLENLSGEDSFHFETNKQYRLVFIGIGTNLIGRVYELPNTNTPVVHLTAGDDAFASGVVGLMVANNAASSGYDGPADTTFDNFLVSTAEPLPTEPLLSIDFSQGVVTVSWPDIPFVLQQTPTLSTPVWAPVTTGIVQEGNRKVYRVSNPAGSYYYRLVSP